MTIFRLVLALGLLIFSLGVFSDTGSIMAFVCVLINAFTVIGNIVILKIEQQD